MSLPIPEEAPVLTADGADASTPAVLSPTYLDGEVAYSEVVPAPVEMVEVSPGVFMTPKEAVEAIQSGSAVATDDLLARLDRAFGFMPGGTALLLAGEAPGYAGGVGPDGEPVYYAYDPLPPSYGDGGEVFVTMLDGETGEPLQVPVLTMTGAVTPATSDTGIAETGMIPDMGQSYSVLTPLLDFFRAVGDSLAGTTPAAGAPPAATPASAGVSPVVLGALAIGGVWWLLSRRR